jgi:F420-dependent oxidoreductase-like protein
VRVGIVVPQGWTGEYEGLTAPDAWARTDAAARRAEQLGFDSVWVFDHFHTTPTPRDTITFEAFTTLSALAPVTHRVGLGQLVTCAGYRNPALVAKVASTLDVISGGRVELGLGAGWKEEEWRAYGYDFPPLRTRMALLRDSLEIASRMFAPGRATWDGEVASVSGAINEPKPLQQPHPPIIVGGNGREVTWRLAARYADELNLDGLPPAEIPEALELVADRCREVDRDPASLRISVHVWWADLRSQSRTVDLLAAYREAGVGRVMALVRDAARTVEAIDAFRDAAAAAGAELEARAD